MKILHISYDYFNTSVYKNLFRFLNVKNNITCVVPLELDQKNKLNIVESDNIIPIFYGRPRPYSVQVNAKKYLKIIDDKIDLSKYKLIHAHFTLNDGLIALKLKKLKGIPYVISVRASCIMNLKRKLAFHNYITVLLVLIKSKAIFFQTKSVLNELLINTPLPFRKIIKKKYHIVHNGIDDFWHENSFKRNYEFDAREFTIITASSIEKNKNLINVAKAIGRLNSNGYKIKYSIAGIVKEKKILQRLKTFDFITYLGDLDKFKLRDAYRNSDIFIMLSHRETFGLVYAEAMSQGLPVIYTKGQGFDCQFEEGLVGLHSSSINLLEIKKVILQVAENHKSMSTNASKLVSKFNWKSIAKKYKLIYSELL
jgi:glycosyltransferase involved in cell wall biosynthesis